MTRDTLIADYRKARDTAMASPLYDERANHSRQYQQLFWMTAEIGVWNRAHSKECINPADVV